MLRSVVLVAIAMSSIALAQQDRATITGSVRDPSGAFASGVKVKVVNAETNASYDSVTNEIGQYTVPNLPVGVYKLTFQGTGLKTLVREFVTLSVAQVARIDAQMDLGEVSESVEVRTDTVLL